jgi:hypothetical protein
MGIDNLQDLRDVCIVAFTIAGTILFLLGIIVALLLVFILLALRSAVSSLSSAVKESVPSALENLRESSENVRNTSSYLSETAVKPIIRFYSVMAGGKRFVRIMGGLMRFGRRG